MTEPIKYAAIVVQSFVISLLLYLFGCTDNSSIPLQFEKGIQQAISNNRSSVVAIEVSNDSSQSADKIVRRGAGVVLEKNGIIATTFDNLSYGNRYNVLFQDGCAAEAKLLGYDRETNIALVTTAEHHCGCFPIRANTEENVSTGSIGILVNNSSVSKGVSAGMGVMAESWLGGDDCWSHPLYITQTGDILTMPGAPVISMDGRLIGICDAMIESHNGSWTVIPTQTILKVARELRQNGAVPRGWIGIACEVDQLEPFQNSSVQPHILVKEVVPASPADLAGLAVGDFVTALNNNPVDNLSQLRYAITGLGVGSNLLLDIVRKSGVPETLQMKSSSLPDDAGRPRLCSTRTL